MSCPAFTPILMKDTLDTSSDYGSDFTPDEEETLNELAKAATEHAALHTTPPPPQQSTTDTTVKETYFAVADIEDSYVAPSSPRTPRVLGRQKPVWQVSRTGRAGPMANGGVAFAFS